jgi:hypothetical protein
VIANSAPIPFSLGPVMTTDCVDWIRERGEYSKDDNEHVLPSAYCEKCLTTSLPVVLISKDTMFILGTILNAN